MAALVGSIPDLHGQDFAAHVIVKGLKAVSCMTTLLPCSRTFSANTRLVTYQVVVGMDSVTSGLGHSPGFGFGNMRFPLL